VIGFQGYAGAALGLLAQSTLLLLGILIIARRLQTKGPAATSLACKAGLVCIATLVALPFVPVHLSRALIQLPPPPQTVLFSQSVSHPESVAASTDQPSQQAEAPLPKTIPSQPVVTASNGAAIEPALSVMSQKPAPAGFPAITWPTAILGLWAFGTAFLLGWVVWAQLKLTSIRHNSVLVREGLAFDRLQRLSKERGVRVPELRIHPVATGPFLAGVLNPAILIDSTVEHGLDADSLDLIFEHELAHLRTRDCTWRLIERIVCALLWPQPLLWKLCRWLDQSSEELCDQVVIANSASRRQYADCLLALANGTPNNRTELTLAVGVVPFRSAVGKRIAKIMDASQRISTRLSPRSRFGIAGAASVLALITVCLVSGSMPGKQVHIQDFPFDKSSDPMAINLFKEVQRAYKEMDSLSMTIKHSKTSNQRMLQFEYKRPGRAIVRQMGTDVLVPKKIVYVEPSRITTAWTEDRKVYEVNRKYVGKTLSKDWSPDMTGLMWIHRTVFSFPLSSIMFLEDVPVPNGLSVGKLTLGPDNVVNGEPVHSLIVQPPSQPGINGSITTMTLTIGKEDHLLRSFEINQRRKDSQMSSSTTEFYEDIRVNPSISDEELTFHAAPGAVEVTPNVNQNHRGPGVQALVDKIVQAYSGLHSLSFEARGERGHLFVSVRKPNFTKLSLKMSWDGREHDYIDSVSDGTNEYVWLGAKANRYMRYAALPDSVGKFGGGGIADQEFRGLLGSVGLAVGASSRFLFWGDLILGPSAFANGVPVDTIVATSHPTDQYGMPLSNSYSKHVFLFGKINHLLYQVQNHEHSVMNGKVWDRQTTETVVHLDIDKPSTESFVFHPGAMTAANSWEQMSPIYNADPAIEVGEKFPEVSANDLQGKPFSLDQYKGKVLLVHAWTQGVGNTQTELPKIESLYDKYKSQGLEVIGIACDSRWSTEKFLKDKGIHTRQLFDGQGVTKGFKDKLHIRRFPFAYVVGRDGKVFAKDPWIPTIEPIIKQALAR